MGVFIANTMPADLQHEYTLQYTDEGQCLNDSIFDPDNGATASVDEIAGQKILTVEAEEHDVQLPETLSFLIHRSDILGIELAPYDNPTNMVLADNCIPKAGN